MRNATAAAPTRKEMTCALPVFDWNSENKAYTRMITANRLATLNIMLSTPVELLAVNSSAK